MPYEAGHTINEAEAKVLNQTRRENLGNNFRKSVKAFNEGAEGAMTQEELQAAFAELDKNYIFTLATAGQSRKLDPVESEARKIARQYLRQELDKAGRKIGTPPEGVAQEDWDATIEAEVDRIATDEQVVKMAKEIVKARSKTANLQLGALGLTPANGGEEAASEATAA
jgi:hypothetical protein